MTGLVLKLGPKERLLINGAVIENGDRRSRINVISPNAHILRLRDAIHPEEATTPVKRVCYLAQLVLSGDADPLDVKIRLQRDMEQLQQIFTDGDSQNTLHAAIAAVIEGQFYQTLKHLRSLLAREQMLLSRSRAS